MPQPDRVRRLADKIKRKGPPIRKKVPRLPDGAEFHSSYSAAKEQWAGTLTIHHEGKKETFQTNARAVFTLLSKLDAFWRKFLAGQKKEAP